MKKVALIYIVTVLIGIASSVIVSSFIAYEAWEKIIMSDLASNEIAQSASNEFMVRYALRNVEKFDRNDKQSIYEYSCLILTSFTKYIKPYSYDNPGRRAELQDLVRRSQELQRRLETEGYCVDP